MRILQNQNVSNREKGRERKTKRYISNTDADAANDREREERDRVQDAK